MVTSPPGPLSHLPPSPCRERGNEDGYNLVMLMVIVTLLNVAVAASLPMWSHVIQRDKEEELISRGFQYAEAIRVFQNRFQRLPVRLEELVEVEPRSIRRLWEDPMTESGKWSLIPVGMGANLTPQPEDPDGRRRRQEEEEEEREEGSPFGGIDKGDEVMVGPFRGVHSRSGRKSILVFNGKERYDEWHFTLELLTGQQAPPQGGAGGQLGGGQGQQGGAGGVPGAASPGFQMSTRWIGRPLPAFLQPLLPNNGVLPGGEIHPPMNQDPGGRPPRGPRGPRGPQPPPEDQ